MSDNSLNQIILAIKTVLRGRSRQLWFGLFSGVIFAAYIVIPVWLTPYSSFDYQFSILRPKDYVLFAALALLTSLLIMMQVFLFSRSRKQEKALAVGRGSAGVASALFGGILATAACASCIAAILGFLGAGSVFFVLDYRLPISIGAITLMLVALYFTGRRVHNHCEHCE